VEIVQVREKERLLYPNFPDFVLSLV